MVSLSDSVNSLSESLRVYKRITIASSKTRTLSVLLFGRIDFMFILATFSAYVNTPLGGVSPLSYANSYAICGVTLRRLKGETPGTHQRPPANVRKTRLFNVL